MSKRTRTRHGNNNTTNDRRRRQTKKAYKRPITRSKLPMSKKRLSEVENLNLKVRKLITLPVAS